MNTIQLTAYFIGGLAAFFVMSCSAPAWAGQDERQEPHVSVHLFQDAGCPYCSKAKSFLENLAEQDNDIKIISYSLANDPQNQAIFRKTIETFHIAVPAVPLIVVGDQYVIGYRSDATSGEMIRSLVDQCREQICPDIVSFLIRELDGAIKDQNADGADPLNRTIRIRFLGEVELSSLSLPVLTIVMAAIDGFNPCAMWVLVFLISLLVGMTDHIRMWALGLAFLATSALVYFVFLAAWLNIFLLLGAIIWIRLAIGVFAIAGGGFHIREYIRNPRSACRVTAVPRRQKIMGRLKDSVTEKGFFYALAGIVAVAIAVNLVELLCSAGLPAVYTQVLSLNALPAWQYYGYLLLYVAVFLFDDLVIFATAMATLQATGLTAAYSRYSHLIGGVILCAIGILLLLRPELLIFATD